MSKKNLPTTQSKEKGEQFPPDIVWRIIDKMGGLGYLDEDYIRFQLRTVEKQVLEKLTKSVISSFKQCYSKNYDDVKHMLNSPATLKAYNDFIPLCEIWLEELTMRRDKLHEEYIAVLEQGY